MALPNSLYLSVIFCAVNGLTLPCSGDGAKIGLAVQRDFLIQRSRLVFEDDIGGPCEVGVARKLHYTASCLWLDFFELTEVSLNARHHNMGCTVMMKPYISRLT